MTEQEPPPSGRIWQRLPQGWLEFRALGERSAHQWIEDYLRTGQGWLPYEAETAIRDGFHAGVAAFEGTDFDFAGVSITLGSHPAVTFLCTNAIPATAAARPAQRSFHQIFALIRFGTDSTAETFTTPDGRVGTVSTATLPTDQGTFAVTVGELALTGQGGSVTVLGLCSDPQQSEELAVQTAFALVTTQVVPDGQDPVLPDFEAGAP